MTASKIPDSFSFELPIRVVPKPRPRVTNSSTYMPREYVRCREQIAMFARAHLPRGWPKGATYELIVSLRVKKSTDGDVDQLGGTIMDALTGIAWEDDRQVIDLGVRKHKGPYWLFVSVRLASEQDFAPKTKRGPRTPAGSGLPS